MRDRDQGVSPPTVRNPSRLRRSLRASTLDATAHAGMVGCGETYFAPFALLLGATPFEAGLLTTVPLLAGGVFQLLAPYIARRIGNKRWVVASAIAQAAAFVPIAALAKGSQPFAWFLGLVCLYWMAGLGINPAWNAWMGEMIPARVRSRYFGRRNVPVQVMLFLSLAAGGSALHLAERTPSSTAIGFVGIFVLAAAFRMLSVCFLIRQHEPPSRQPLREPTIAQLARGLRGLPYGRLITLVALTNGAVHIAAPYFTPFMLEELHLSYAEFTILNGAVLVARLVSSPYWGEVARTYGNRRALQVSTLLITPLPALWAVSGEFAYLLVVQLVAGFAWAGFELAIVLSFFDCTDQENRARVLSVYNLLNGLTVVVGSLLGGALLQYFGSEGYLYVLAVSSALRGIAVVFFSRNAGIRRPGEHAFREVFVRVISLRPGQGPALRPIVMDEMPKSREQGATSVDPGRPPN